MSGGKGQPPAPPGGVRSWLPAVLWTDSYRRLWYTGLLYYQSHWMEITITGWVVLSFTGSAAAVGIVAFFRTLPMLLFGLVFGTLADRYPRIGVLLSIQIAGMLSAGGFSILFFSGFESVALICVLSTVIGCAWAADFAARRALIAELSPPETTASAMSLEALSLQGGKIVAPVIAGLLLGFGGPVPAYLFLTVMFGFGMLVLYRLHQTGVARRDIPATTVSILQLLQSGWMTAIQIPIIRVALIVTVLMNLLVFPYQQLIAVVAGEILEVGPGRMGVLSGAAGVGSAMVAGYLTFRSRPRLARQLFVGGATLGAIGLIGLAMSTNFAVSVGLQLVLGACFGAFGAMQPVLIASAVAPEMRARALGVLAMAIGTSPIGILLTGGLSSMIGPSKTIGGLATIASVALIFTIVRYRRELGIGQPSGSTR